MPHLVAMAALRIPAGPEWVQPKYWYNGSVAAIKANVICHKYEEADRLMVEQLIAGRWEKNLHITKVLWEVIPR